MGAYLELARESCCYDSPCCTVEEQTLSL
jgi:hypothetical protein